jgi:hypothetical protein
MYLLLVEDIFVDDVAVTDVVFSITYKRNNGIKVNFNFRGNSF